MAAQFGASSSFSSAPIQPWTYHVFLSFRGEDTRNTFTGHLYSNLVQKGINTFIDDDGLPRGEQISSSLLKAIEESKISVVVFSENYASSKWCLEELVKIMQCNESRKQIVYPLFYKVDPSNVRNQTGSFGEALSQHDDLEKLARWKTALTKAGNLSGWHFSHGGHESDFVHKIVEDISQQLSNFTYFNGDKYLVGMQSRLENMEKVLCVGEGDIRMIGIWGIGGLGKTTIAKAVYNSVAHKFDSSCFLENVRERSLIYGGLQKLQKFLLSKTLGLKELKINSLDEGSYMIKERLSRRRILLILDDVNDLDQLRSLAGKPDWFGSGSRIIITTRDQDLLRRHDVDQIYQVDKLSDREALELFKINAFKEKEHMSDYIEHIDSVIRYAEGLPLVLEVLGSHLRGISIDSWKDTLEHYKKNPKLQQFLKLSYDALEPLVREVFLHIACFFKGGDKNYVMDILEGCELPKHGIEVLIQKALISITESNGIWMHDLLEEMGKEIVCQESPEPGERSRLWLYKDVYNVFKNNTGTNKVKGIMLKESIRRNADDIHEKIPLNSESFSKLNGLQILLIDYLFENVFSGNRVDYLPNELVLLHWVQCPLQYFPSNFYPKKLVVCKMEFTLTSPKIGVERKMPWICMSPLGAGVQSLQKLKSLELVFCNGAEVFPDFSRFLKLEELMIRSSKKIEKIEIVKEMKSLKRLNLRGTAIREFPSSAIGHLINLEQLILSGCQKLRHVSCNIFELQHLQLLDLSTCDELVTFPTKSDFSTESASLQDKHNAPLFVDLSWCRNLVEIGEFPREIYGLGAAYCSKLQRISKLSNILEGNDSRMIPQMNLSGSESLYRNLVRKVAKMKKNLPDHSGLTALFSLFFSCRQSEYRLKLPLLGINIFPEWFSGRMDVNRDRLQGRNFRIDFPGNFKWEDKGLAFWPPMWWFKFRIYINGVSIIDTSNKWGEGRCYWTYGGFQEVYYMPFEAIIKRLSEGELPSPYICLIKFEFELHNNIELFDGTIMEFDPRSCGVHLVMPEGEGPFFSDFRISGEIQIKENGTSTK